jgi:hypothetical protein
VRDFRALAAVAASVGIWGIEKGMVSLVLSWGLAAWINSVCGA